MLKNKFTIKNAFNSLKCNSLIFNSSYPLNVAKIKH